MTPAGAPHLHHDLPMTTLSTPIAYPFRPGATTPIELPEVLLPIDHGHDALSRAVRAGEAVQLAKGIYARPPAPDEPRWRVRQHHLLARAVGVNRYFGGTVALSHATAALVHGLWAPIEDHPHVTHSFHAHKAPGDEPFCIRTCRPLDESEVVTINGLRVTSLERTVLDCIASLSAPWALAVADSAMRVLTRAERTDPEGAIERADSVRMLWARGVEAKGPRRGRRQAREIVRHACGLSESAGESRTRCVCLAAGLPPPRMQMRVVLAGGNAYPDLSFEIQRLRTGPRWVHVEYDGEVKYGIPPGLDEAEAARRVVEEKRREDELREDPSTKTVIRVVNESLAWPARSQLVSRIARECEVQGPLTPISALNPPPPRARQRR